MTYFGKFDDFPYISTVDFDPILFRNIERSRSNETQSKVDHWDCACPARTGCDTVRLANIYAFWWIWNDERLRIWNAYDVLWVWHDAVRDVIHVADPLRHIDTHRLGHRVARKTADHQSLILF